MTDGVPRKPREIADILGLTPGAASAAMGRMARAGVLERVGAGQYRCITPSRCIPTRRWRRPNTGESET
jgi:hypothetical protein